MEDFLVIPVPRNLLPPITNLHSGVGLWSGKIPRVSFISVLTKMSKVVGQSVVKHFGSPISNRAIGRHIGFLLFHYRWIRYETIKSK